MIMEHSHAVPHDFTCLVYQPMLAQVGLQHVGQLRQRLKRHHPCGRRLPVAQHPQGKQPQVGAHVHHSGPGAEADAVAGIAGGLKDLSVDEERFAGRDAADGQPVGKHQALHVGWPGGWQAPLSCGCGWGCGGCCRFQGGPLGCVPCGVGGASAASPHSDDLPLPRGEGRRALF